MGDNISVPININPDDVTVKQREYGDCPCCGGRRCVNTVTRILNPDGTFSEPVSEDIPCELCGER